MTSLAESDRKLFGKPFLYVLLIGVAVRLYNSYFTFYINSDGVLYINQAKMIFYGRLDLLPTSGLPNLSNYPFLIAGAFAVLRDWFLAAKFVSFLFGSLTLIPVYLLFNRFFSRSVSSLGTLIYALVPVLVSRSADVIRDPVYWFFLVFGIYFFSFFEAKKARLYLFLSCLSFLLATWARVEAFLFVGVTAIFILVSGPRRLENLFFFGLPLLCIAGVFSVGLVFYNHDLSFLSRTSDFGHRITLPLKNYQALGNDIEHLKNSLAPVNFQLREFLPKAGNFAWIIALGSIFNHFLEGFFYPFCLVLLLGLKGSWQKVRTEKFPAYLSLLIVSGGLLLFGHMVTWWNFDARFLALVMFPIFIFTGYGLENSLRLIKNRYSLRTISVYFIVFGLLLATGLPKNLYFREKDKLVFRQIGTYVAEREHRNPDFVSILTSGAIRQLAFYANQDKPDLIFPLLVGLDAVTGNSCDDLLAYLRTSQTHYFLWEEKFWLGQAYSPIDQSCHANLIELKRWHHPDTGQMILYKVRL
jgi:hypothetical protein